jgi:hypothetical protein
LIAPASGSGVRAVQEAAHALAEFAGGEWLNQERLRCTALDTIHHDTTNKAGDVKDLNLGPLTPELIYEVKSADPRHYDVGDTNTISSCPERMIEIASGPSFASRTV